MCATKIDASLVKIVHRETLLHHTEEYALYAMIDRFGGLSVSVWGPNAQTGENDILWQGDNILDGRAWMNNAARGLRIKAVNDNHMEQKKYIFVRISMDGYLYTYAPSADRSNPGAWRSFWARDAEAAKAFIKARHPEAVFEN